MPTLTEQRQDSAAPGAGSVAVVVAGRVTQSVAFVALSALAGRALAPEDFGHFSLALALIGFGSVVGVGGQGRLALADSPERGRLRGVQARRRVVVGCGFVAGALSGGWFGWINGSAVHALAVFFAAFVGALVVFEADVARAEGRSVPAEATTGRNGGPIALVLACSLLGASLIGFLPAVSLTSTLVVIGALTCVSLVVSGRDVLASPGAGEGWQSYARRSRWLWASQLVAQSMQVVDLLVAAAVLPAEGLAVYAAARLVAMQGSFFLQVSSLAHARAVATTFGQGERRALARLLQRAALLAAVPAAGLVALSAVAGDWAMPVVFGDALFADGTSVLILLGLASLINASTGLAGYVLSVADEARALTVCNLASVVLVAVLGMLLGSLHGAIGVAAVVAMTSLLYNVAVVTTVWRRVGVRPDVFAFVASMSGR